MSDWHKSATGPVKREAGERPARSRRCNKGVIFRFVPLGGLPGKVEYGNELKVRRPACRTGTKMTTRNWHCTHLYGIEVVFDAVIVMQKILHPYRGTR